MNSYELYPLLAFPDIRCIHREKWFKKDTYAISKKSVCYSIWFIHCKHCYGNYSLVACCHAKQHTTLDSMWRKEKISILRLYPLLGKNCFRHVGHGQVNMWKSYFKSFAFRLRKNNYLIQMNLFWKFLQSICSSLYMTNFFPAGHWLRSLGISSPLVARSRYEKRAHQMPIRKVIISFAVLFSQSI